MTFTSRTEVLEERAWAEMSAGASTLNPYTTAAGGGRGGQPIVSASGITSRYRNREMQAREMGNGYGYTKFDSKEAMCECRTHTEGPGAPYVSTKTPVVYK